MQNKPTDLEYAHKLAEAIPNEDIDVLIISMANLIANVKGFENISIFYPEQLPRLNRILDKLRDLIE